ncbi:MAG: winged helix-turn-helix domain-containing protein [Acidobacteriota bacterium]
MIAPSITDSPQNPTIPRIEQDPLGAAKLQLAEWTFSPQLNRICKGSQKVHLEPQLAKLLLFLVRGEGRVLSKDEIIDGVWGTRFVADSAITRAVAELRRALGDDAHHPRFIETIPKRGYRWLPQSEILSETCVAGALLTSATPDRSSRATLPRLRNALVGAGLCAALAGGLSSIDRLSSAASDASTVPLDLRIAVLPFDNLAGDPDEDYFAVGMTEALTTNLARVDVLSVISRRSVEFLDRQGRSTAEIAQALDVDAIVEGSVLRSKERVRFTVQLTDADSDTHLWAQIYERQMSDVLTLQSEIALAISREIRDALQPEALQSDALQSDAATTGSGSFRLSVDQATASASQRSPQVPDRPVDPGAYELYLKGRQQLGRCDVEGPNQTASYFHQALKIDPDYAPAYAGLAHYYAQLAFYGHLSTSKALPLARAAADKALELDDNVAEAHLASAIVRFIFDWDWSGAESAFRRALELSPGDAWIHERYSFFLTCLGRFPEAIEAGQRAVALDPLNTFPRTSLAWVHLNARDHHQSLSELQQVEALGLADEPGVYASWNYALMGRYTEAIRLIDEAPPHRDDSERHLHLSVLGWVQARAGNTDEARDLLHELQYRARSGEAMDPYYLAIVHAGLGDHASTLAALEEALAVRSPNLIYLRVEPFFETLHADPRYRRLQERVGLG